MLLNDLINNIKKFSLKQKDFDFYHKKFQDLKKDREKKLFCIDCGIEITKYSKSGKCMKCYSFSKRKVCRPPKHILSNEIKELGCCGTGRKYGVSDTTIRKWLKE